MHSEIRLDPNKIRFNAVFLQTPEDFVISSYGPALRTLLVEYLLGPDVDKATFEATLEQVIQQNPQDALQQALRIEREWAPRGEDTLTTRVRQSVGIDLNSATLPQAFLHEASWTLRTQLGVFDELERVRRSEIGRSILQFVREVSTLSTAMCQGAGIDQVYEYVQSRALDPVLTVTADTIELLHVLVYLPFHLRYPIQESLIHRPCIEWLRGHAKQSEDSKVKECALLLEKRFQIDCLNNSHWERLAKQYGASERLMVALGQQSIERLENSRQLRENVPANILASVYQPLSKFYDSIVTTMRKVELDCSSSFWQHIDIGHCFYGTVINVATLANEGTPLGYVDKKNGSYAVVLEDDPEQLRLWTFAVQSYSDVELLPENGGRCGTIADIQPWLGDPRISLYLLDTEIENDRSAGIRTACDLISRLTQMDLSAFPKKIMIVVWSASLECSQRAEAELRRVIDSDPQPSIISFGSPGSSRISVSTRLKSGVPFFPYFTQT